MSALPPIPLDSIHDLAELLGPMPPGDVPAAWFISTDDEVLAAWDKYKEDSRAWFAGWDELLAISGLPKTTRAQIEEGLLVGLVPPPGAKRPGRWWRYTPTGLLVPRRRTRAEKASEVNALWARLEEIPEAINYLPGMPKVLFSGEKTYVPVARKPAAVVLVFLGYDPDKAAAPFVPTEAWYRLKISTYLTLVERQQAAENVR